MYKAKTNFHDAKDFRLYTEGMVITWDDADRIKSALDRGLIEEVKEPKAEKKEEPKPKKAKAKKK